MRYFIALFCPPLAVLLCGKPGKALLNFFLTLLFWIPGVIHAFMVISEHKADLRMEQQTKALVNAQQQASSH